METVWLHFRALCCLVTTWRCESIYASESRFSVWCFLDVPHWPHSAREELRTRVTLYLIYLISFLCFKFQEFQMFSTSVSLGGGIFLKWHLPFSRSIRITLILADWEPYVWRSYKLTNRRKCRGLSKRLRMQGNCLVSGNSGGWEWGGKGPGSAWRWPPFCDIFTLHLQQKLQLPLS